MNLVLHASCRTSPCITIGRARLACGTLFAVPWPYKTASGRLFASSRSSKPPKKKATSSHPSHSKPAIQNAPSPPVPQPKPFQDHSHPSKSPRETFRGTAGNAPPTPSGALDTYPERLLIYHAGTGRLVFISMIKLSTIFLFIFCALYIAPAYYFSPLEDTYKSFVILGAGAVPLLMMTYTTAPFVAYVHLGMPSWARSSQARLHRYASNLPAKAALDVTSLKWIWPRVTRLAADELYLKKTPVLGSMTLRRNIPQGVWDERRWYTWRPLGEFYVAGKGGKVPEIGIWEQVLECISRGFGRYGERSVAKKPLKATSGFK